jgi:hypothetical protein
MTVRSEGVSPWTHENILAVNTRRLDAVADLLLVTVDRGTVNVTVAGAQSSLDGVLYLIGLGLLSPVSVICVLESIKGSRDRGHTHVPRPTAGIS